MRTKKSQSYTLALVFFNFFSFFASVYSAKVSIPRGVVRMGSNPRGTISSSRILDPNLLIIICAFILIANKTHSFGPENCCRMDWGIPNFSDYIRTMLSTLRSCLKKMSISFFVNNFRSKMSSSSIVRLVASSVPVYVFPNSSLASAEAPIGICLMFVQWALMYLKRLSNFFTQSTCPIILLLLSLSCFI